MKSVSEILPEDSYFVNNGFHHELLNDIGQRLTTAETEHLQYLSFVLLKPDAVMSGKAKQVIDFLEHSGLNVVDVSALLQPHPSQFEQLYKFNLTRYNQQNMLGAWWLNRRLYEMGPSLLLVVRSRGGRCTAHTIVSTLKGPSSPYQGRVNELRYELGASNRSINLMHSSDGPISTVREFLIFHSWDRLRHVIRTSMTAAVNNCVGQDATVKRDLERILMSVSTVCIETDFLRVLFALKQRVRTLLINNKVIEADADVEQIYQKLWCAVAKQASLLARTIQYSEFSSPLAALLRKRYQSQGSVDKTGLLQVYCDLHDIEQINIDVAQLACCTIGANGVYIDDWEQLILETSAYYLTDFLHAKARACTEQSSEVGLCAE